MILEGEVDVHSGLSKPVVKRLGVESRIIQTAKAGQVFGVEVLSAGVHSHTRRAGAMGCECLRIEDQDLQDLFETHPADGEQLFTNLIRSYIMQHALYSSSMRALAKAYMSQEERAAIVMQTFHRKLSMRRSQVHMDAFMAMKFGQRPAHLERPATVKRTIDRAGGGGHGEQP